MFNGQFATKRKIALGGRSRQEENREQALQRAREDRERRRKQREEQKGAAVIQSWFRGRTAWRDHKAVLRRRWIEDFGERGESASLSAPGGRCLRDLLAFCSPRDAPDVLRLAVLCRALVDGGIGGGGNGGGGGGGSKGPSCSVHQAKRLAALCLRAIHSREDLREQLTGRAPMTADTEALTGALLMLTDPRSWPSEAAAKASGGVSSSSSSPAYGVVLYAASPTREGSDLFGCFRELLEDRWRSTGGNGNNNQGPAPPFAALFVALLRRFLEADGAQHSSLEAGASRALPPGLSSLMCVPAVWRCCPGLRDLATPVWRRLVGALPAGPAATSKEWEWLPASSGPGGRAGAAAALLGNLLEVTHTALRQTAAAARGEGCRWAEHGCGVFLALLGVVPVRTLFPAEDGDDAEDEDEDVGGPGGVSGGVSGRGGGGGFGGSRDAEIPWAGREPPPPGLRMQLETFFDPQLLSCLVELMLPDVEPDRSAQDGGDEAMPDAGPATGDAEAEREESLERSVRRLCRLLYALLSLSRHLGAGSQAGERLLSSLAFSAGLVQRLWGSFLRTRELEHSWRPSIDDGLSDPGWMLPLAVLCPVYTCTLNSISGDGGFPLPPAEIYSPEAPKHGFLGLLKRALWQQLWVENSQPPGGWAPAAAQLRAELKVAGGRLLRHLHDRNVLRRFAPAEAFLAEDLSHERFSKEILSALSARGSWDRACASASRAWALLQHAPCLVSFPERARVFQMLVSADRREVRDRQALHMGPNTFASIRRDQIVSDGFQALNGLGDGLKEQIRVVFVNQFGENEAGVDGGGLFKDFIGEIVKTAFDTRYGFFKATADNRLYPNPAAGLVHENPMGMFEFLGRILGKAIYEGILLELPLAGFFLKKFQSLRMNDINDLPSLDPELYKQLMFLRSYEGDVSDLALTFSITDAELGHMREVDLVPGGSSIPVTNQNRISYIFFVANYRLNRVIAPACSAFLRGVHELIPPEWLQMFNEDELRMLICGSTAGIDLEDLKAHIHYAGGYHEDHPVIHVFWEVMHEMQPEDQESFLRFITSCSRPPLLGFEYLEPHLCIQMSGSMLDEERQERLPTASTCVNLLKLPPYRTKEAMREKLLYAVTSGAGFDLS